MRKRKSHKGWIGRGLYGIVLIGGLAGILLAVAQGVTVTLRPGVRGRPPRSSAWMRISHATLPAAKKALMASAPPESF